MLLVLPHAALAEPTGGNVVSGAASIVQTGPVTDVNQSTKKAIINWQSFSIAPQETVNFKQPDVSSVTLNRVIGNEKSVIEGALNANGQVFIVNSAGVLFSRGASVNVGGLVASTLDISNDDFNAGNYTFSGSSTASVVNQGSLSAAEGGYISLLGNTVSNQGVISATLGTAALGAGSKVKLNFGGNSLVDVTIDKGVLNALSENKQLIRADGGKVILTARAADAILAAQVNNSGVVQARTMATLTGGGYSKGSIELNAHGGKTNVSGTLDASAPDGGDGGFIETSGDKVMIEEDAVITTKTAYGATGTWLIDPDGFTIASIGGDITGAKLSHQLASNNITIQSTQGSGSSGNIDVNGNVTWFAGTILTLDATNAINVNAPITATNGGLALNAGTDVNINATAALQVASLEVTALGDVNINAPQLWTRNGAWTFNGHNINVNDTVDWWAGTLTLNAGAAGGFINLNAAMTASGNAGLVVTYNTGMDTSTEDVTDLYGDVFTQPTATYGTPFGGINPLFDPAVGTFVGKIDFLNITAANPLTINGNSYTLITSMQQLAGLSTALRNPDGSIATDPDTGDPLSYTTASGYYALATNLDASGTVYPGAVIYQLTGTLEGLGHTVNNLTIAPPAVTDAYGNTNIEGDLGLIGTVGTSGGGIASGTVRNIGIVSVQINDTLPGWNGGGDSVGALAGTNYGTIRNAFATGSPDAPVPPGSPFDGTSYPRVTAAVAAGYDVGGLVGRNYGLIADSHADVAVYGIGYVGGFVGRNVRSSGGCCGDAFGVILNSYATGTVSAGQGAFSTGGATGSNEIGGFVGYNTGGVISYSDAAGQIWTLNSSNIGGFAGGNAGYSALGTLNNVSSSGTINIGWDAYQGYGGAAGGLVGSNEGLVNGGHTTSNIVTTTLYYTNEEYGYSEYLLFENIGAAFGNQGGIANGATADGLVSYNGNSGPSQQNYTGGWDFGGTTNPIYNPGAGGTPPQQSALQAAQQLAVQRPADAQSQAQTLTQGAAAALQQAVGSTSVAATTGVEKARKNAATPSDAKAGSAATQAKAGPKLEDKVDLMAAPPAVTQVSSVDKRRRRKGAPADAGADYGAQIKSIDVDGQHFDLGKDGKTPAQGAPAPAPGGQQ